MDFYRLTLLFFLIASSAFSQSILKGRLLDASTGEQLVGATIKIQPLNLTTATKLDGSFTFKNIASNSYRIHCASLTYKSLDTTVFIDRDVDLTFYLRKLENDLQDVTIIGTQDGGSQKYARRAEQKSDNVSNIVSAKSIQLSPDITVANVLQRVSGVSIERSNTGDGQHAIIRGMDKRYNVTLINGVKIPSPDNRNRFVPLDIFPADLLERLEVVKSLTPDMEADASGGAINIVMKDAPSTMVLNASLATGYSQIFLNQPASVFNTGVIQLKSPAELNGNNYLATVNDFTKD
ncbi:MAG: TonB-dependent receptor plug domain-containing protein, partial [Pedobacter sp.]|nr:TonB-dependent receptor plug domain-containing protein [Pedobacter sp.]